MIPDLAITGAQMTNFGGFCPVQAEGSVDGHAWYFRARGDHCEFHVAKTDADIFSNNVFYADKPCENAGWLETGEAVEHITGFIGAFRTDQQEKSMTTRVTVDAHAGWPILVTLKHGEPSAAKSVSTEIVPPNVVKEFYIHSGLQIIGIEEQPRQQEPVS